MQSPLIPLQENPGSNSWKNEKGFSLLEVIVALAIMAGGFLAVLNLFSGSVRSVDFSGQYLKAITLANSKMNELEIANFAVDDQSGSFENEENYRWELDITPYDSELNDEETNIQLQKVLLKVLWNDSGNSRNIELATLRLEGQTRPVADTKLEQLFKGGAGTINSSGGQDDTGQSESSASSTSTTSSNISGGPTSNISGSGTTVNISGN
ncbi:MAG: prepilin-type N-terminal cleavage/methylation domain-containing protein [Nitrospinae bacterium]|nr:prepilin-type N-terminal cleavage/methylation domain-containing protein [Nitrospinota bacterium]MZH04397.1 prepilin-type N-terminal cleavage/methylation domain-containing protein [Nitrospinota bacterium]MZH14807.1 prepilin-type N-terminal cleavage/methylation domain-containing protein [Nitrospinota bacterium]